MINPRRPLTIIPLAAVVVLALIAAPGCGDAAGEDSDPSYAEVLNELKLAAASNRPARAVDRARELGTPAEKDVLLAFCRTAWSLQLNNETDVLRRDAEYLDRIRHLAEYRLIDEVEPVTAAMAKLRETLDVTSIDPKMNSRYKQACYDGQGET